MAQKDLHHRITGDSSSLEGAANRGAGALSKMDREARRLEQQQRRTHRAMTMVGQGMLVAGAAIAAGLALSARAAIEWESAWAGVLKTVDGTPEQMAALEKEIRALTGVLPATHQEIAAVAEAAGQLGIQRENVAEFTKVMIDMGEATNLSATEAATALARFMNIMQTAPGEVENLGSAIVDLGNNSATTESEIVEMGLRIAGAGQAIGLTESEVLSFSAALSSVGIRAQAGGTAISRVFIDIDKAVREGGDQLETFAQVAGVSASEFQQAYQEDAAGAIDTFVQGLGRIQASGGDVNAVLEELGFTEVRVADALRRLAGSGDLLTQSLETGSSAWEENAALAAEAERRYGTTAARIEIARNQVNDFAIDMGNTLLPALGSVVDRLSSLAGVIGDLPGPVKTTLAILATLTAALLLAGGTALIAVPKIAAFRAALDQIAAAGGRAAAGVGLLRGAMSFFLGPWGVAIAAAAAVATAAFGAWSSQQAEARQEARQFADTLDDMTGAFTDATRALVAHKLEESGALESARKLGLSLAEVTDIVMSGGDAMAALQAAVVEADNAYFMFEGNLVRAKGSDEQARAWMSLKEAIGGTSGELVDGVDAWQRTTEAQEGTAEAAGQLDPALQGAASAMGLATDSVDNLVDSLFELENQILGMRDAERAFEEAIDAASDAIEENGENLDTNTEKGRANEEALDGIASAAHKVLEQQVETGASTEEMRESMERARKKFVDTATQMGMTRGEAKDLADQLGLIPDDVETVAKLKDQMTARINALEDRLDALDGKTVDTFINTWRIEYTRREGRGPGGRFQHGGEVTGPGGIDRVPISATAGEFVVRRDVSQRNLAALRAFNETGRFPVQAAIGGGSAGPTGSGGGDGAMLEGALYLDSGEFLGKVRGVVRQGISEHNRDVKQAVLAGAGRAR